MHVCRCGADFDMTHSDVTGVLLKHSTEERDAETGSMARTVESIANLFLETSSGSEILTPRA